MSGDDRRPEGGPELDEGLLAAVRDLTAPPEPPAEPALGRAVSATAPTAAERARLDRRVQAVLADRAAARGAGFGARGTGFGARGAGFGARGTGFGPAWIGAAALAALLLGWLVRDLPVALPPVSRSFVLDGERALGAGVFVAGDATLVVREREARRVTVEVVEGEARFTAEDAGALRVVVGDVGVEGVGEGGEGEDPGEGGEGEAGDGAGRGAEGALRGAAADEGGAARGAAADEGGAVRGAAGGAGGDGEGSGAAAPGVRIGATEAGGGAATGDPLGVPAVAHATPDPAHGTVPGGGAGEGDSGARAAGRSEVPTGPGSGAAEPVLTTRGSAAEELANLFASGGGPDPGAERSEDPGAASAASGADNGQAEPGGYARIGDRRGGGAPRAEGGLDWLVYRRGAEVELRVQRGAAAVFVGGQRFTLRPGERWSRWLPWMVSAAGAAGEAGSQASRATADDGAGPRAPAPLDPGPLDPPFLDPLLPEPGAAGPSALPAGAAPLDLRPGGAASGGPAAPVGPTATQPGREAGAGARPFEGSSIPPASRAVPLSDPPGDPSGPAAAAGPRAGSAVSSAAPGADPRGTAALAASPPLPPEATAAFAELLRRRDAGAAPADLLRDVDRFRARWPRSAVDAEAELVRLDALSGVLPVAQAGAALDRWLAEHPADPRRDAVRFLAARVAAERAGDCGAAARYLRLVEAEGTAADAERARVERRACGR